MNNTNKSNNVPTPPKPKTDFDYRNGAQTLTYRKPSSPPPPKPKK